MQSDSGVTSEQAMKDGCRFKARGAMMDADLYDGLGRLWEYATWGSKP